MKSRFPLNEWVEVSTVAGEYPFKAMIKKIFIENGLAWCVLGLENGGEIIVPQSDLHVFLRKKARVSRIKHKIKLIK